MAEREPQHETIGRGELFYLDFPAVEGSISGYGLTIEAGHNDQLVGLLIVDKPRPADPDWLQSIADAFGECQLVPMTSAGERGLLCNMQIDGNSQEFIRRMPGTKADEIQAALAPLLESPPAPSLRLWWEAEASAWRSEFQGINELPGEVKELFGLTGYGCLALESNVGIIHVCHAPDEDIQRFVDKPVLYQWQLIKMPTAPLIRLDITVVDDPLNPYKFESFLNIAADDQAAVLAQLANQDRLYLAFYGDGLSYRFTKVVGHDEQQWQQLDDLAHQAVDFWSQIPPSMQDFDLAKAEFMGSFI
jgi:hypothetical protein